MSEILLGAIMGFGACVSILLTIACFEQFQKWGDWPFLPLGIIASGFGILFLLGATGVVVL